jgi:hypothetical protein
VLGVRVRVCGEAWGLVRGEGGCMCCCI